MQEPTKKDVDAAIMSVALRELEGKPTGSTVLISECTGFKKMPFLWVVRVHGWKSAIKMAYRDFIARRTRSTH